MGFSGVEMSVRFSPLCPAALSHGAAVSQVWARRGRLLPALVRVTATCVEPRGVRGLWCCAASPLSLVDGVCTVVSPHTRPSVENENGITADGHAVICCAIMPHSQHVPLTRSCWSGRRECWSHLRRPFAGDQMSPKGHYITLVKPLFLDLVLPPTFRPYECKIKDSHG